MANQSVINMVNEAIQLHFIRKTKYKIENLAIENMNKTLIKIKLSLKLIDKNQ